MSAEPPRTPALAGREAAQDCVLAISADPLAVRAALQSICARNPVRSLPEPLRATVELVLAEVLNNIVEHAYDGAPGLIEISLRRQSGALHCTVTDGGRPMAQGTLPQGHLPQPDARDLPEGGFGWFLIRELSHDLRYARAKGRNVLSFCLACDAASDRLAKQSG